MNEPACDLDGAVEAWLQAYEGYRDYLRASEVLYTAFANGWRGSRRSLVEAFAVFRESLITECEYKILEVTEVHPTRNLRPK
jgi:hypothetical protein